MARFGTYSENTSPADADLLVSVDVSDTTDDATGSTKRLSLSGLRTFFGASPTFTGTTTTAALTATDGILSSGSTGSSVPSAKGLEVINTNATSGEQRFKLSVTNAGDPRLDAMSDDGSSRLRNAFVARSDGEFRLTDNTSVSVPVPTTTGDALRWGSDATVAALTATGAITAASTGTAQIVLTDTDAATDRKTSRLWKNGNITTLQTMNDDGSTNTTIYTISHTGDHDITFNAPIAVPVATAATHAAQVSARDATYGQLAIGGVEMGDTGWRDVTADAAAALTAGTIRMKRHGNTVHVSLLGTKMAVNTTYYTLPTGFGIDNYSGMYYSFSQLARSAASVNTVWMRSIGQALHISSHTGTWNASGDYLNASFSFETQNAWPTTLPGTQITAPA